MNGKRDQAHVGEDHEVPDDVVLGGPHTGELGIRGRPEHPGQHEHGDGRERHEAHEDAGFPHDEVELEGGEPGRPPQPFREARRRL